MSDNVSSPLDPSDEAVTDTEIEESDVTEIDDIGGEITETDMDDAEMTDSED